MRTELKVAAVVLLALAAAGCRQDMHDQPRYTALQPSAFFGDGRSARPLPEGTVARGQLAEDTLFHTGRGPGGQFAREFPFPVTREVIERGRERYNVYCSVCHDRVGEGQGMIVRRGYRQPPSFHIDRLRTEPAGHFFDVITNGFGAMPNYAVEVEPADRWAIVAYIRALQRSQRATVSDVPPEDRPRLEGVPR